MSAPLKRVCRQAVRQASQCRSQSMPPKTLPETLQCHRAQTSWKPSSHLSQQRRALSQSSRPQQQQLEQEDDAYDPMDEVLSSLPSESELSSTGYAELEQHRELREMVRVAAWEMPLLTRFAKRYQKKTQQEAPLRWRYTTYFGEAHPASSKVVVEFKVGGFADLKKKQAEKLKKLCGARYNPSLDTVRMSCESFDTQAQNKRYLGEVIEKLIAEAKDPEADSFEDVPLDTRHHKLKQKLQYTKDFPEEWKLTEEKRTGLEDKRRRLLLAEAQKVEENTLVSGAAVIEAARKASMARVAQPVMVEAKAGQQRRR